MPNLPPAVEKVIQDVDKRLHEPGTITDLLGKVEAKTGVKRLHLIVGLILLHAFYLLFGRWAELLCNITGFLYPAYISIKAIETTNKDDDKEWLTYWVVFALLNVVEFFSNTIVHYFPFYWLLKCAFLIYLYLPMTMGAQKLYDGVIRPFHLKHHNKVDGFMNSVQEKARQGYEEHVKPN